MISEREDIITKKKIHYSNMNDAVIIKERADFRASDNDFPERIVHYAERIQLLSLLFRVIN